LQRGYYSLEWSKRQVELAIDKVLSGSEREDTVLIVFYGQSFRAENGRLYFGLTDTDPMYLASTAMAASWLMEQMEDSRATSKIVLLDCCYAGAFDHGHGLRGRGNQVVIASADARKESLQSWFLSAHRGVGNG
jgi:uncharacterized caspase-like protein